MSYDYQTEKHKIFEPENQQDFLKARDQANKLLEVAGAFMIFRALQGITGDTWTMMAYIDRLKELGEIREITDSNTMGQYRVFVKGKEND
jgi:hypothetical protein